MINTSLDKEILSLIESNVLAFKGMGLGLSDFFTLDEVKENSKGKTTTFEKYIEDMEKEYPGSRFWGKSEWPLPVSGRVECRKLMARGRGMFGVDSEIYVLEDAGVIAVFVWNDIEAFRRANQGKRRHHQISSSHHWDDDDDWGAGNNYHTGGNDHYSQSELDNHANQCNPNNDAYWSSRK